jgi:anti-sigma factor (TIGR02949 family)
VPALPAPGAGNVSTFIDPCEKCEEVMQPYLDRALDDHERAEAEAHLAQCGYCRKRYRFEESLRIFVRRVAAEEMPPELKQKLAALRTPL